ncbi:hypothetical protein PCE1_001516 [Barthelona sp. PCE]
MSFTKVLSIPPGPNMTRARPQHYHPSVDEEHYVYGSNLNVISRNINDFHFCESFEGHSHAVTSAKFFENGNFVISGDEEGNVIIWSYDNPEHPITLESKPVAGPIKDLAMTQDHKKFIAVGEYRRHGAHPFTLMGTTAGECLGHTDHVLSADIRRNKRPYITITGGEDRIVNMYRGPPCKHVAQVAMREGVVNCVRWDPSGDKFAVAGADKLLQVYSVTIGEATKRFGPKTITHDLLVEKEFPRNILSLCWTPDSSKIVFCGTDKAVTMVDAETLEVIWRVVLGKEIGHMQNCVFHTKRGFLVFSTAGDMTLIDVEGSIVENIPTHSSTITTIHATQNRLYTYGREGNFIIWDRETMTPVKRLLGKGHGGASVTAIFEWNGKIVTCGHDSNIYVTDPDTDKFGEKISTPYSIEGAAMIGDVIYCAFEDGVSAVNLATKSVTTLQHGCMCIATNSTHIAMGSESGTVTVLNAETMAVEYQEKVSSVPVKTVAISASGNIVACGAADSRVIIIDVEAKTYDNNHFSFHSSIPTNMRFIDETRFYSVGLDGEMFLFDATDRNTRIRTSHIHRQGCTSLEVFDGAIYTGGVDGFIHKWVVN